MTKETFLNDLRAALEALPEAEKEGALSYYAEMIDDRMEAGMSEEAAVKAMEPVQEIAARVLEESGFSGAKTEKKADDRQEIVRPADSFAALRIQAENKRVRIIPAPADSPIVLRYTIGEYDIFRLNESNGTLTLEHKLRPLTSFVNERSGEGFSLESILSGVSRFITGLGERIISGAMFNYDAPENEIEVVLPEGFAADVGVSTSNARISGENLTLKGQLSLSTSNAAIQLDTLRCAQGVALSTSNSRLVLNGLNASEARLTTSNGSVTVSGAAIAESLTASNSNGAVRASGTKAGKALVLTTSNGAIHLENADSPSLTLKTSNGSISGTLCGSRDEYTVSSSTSNGINRLGNFGSGPRRLSAVTSNAAIALEFAESEKSID